MPQRLPIATAQEKGGNQKYYLKKLDELLIYCIEQKKVLKSM